MTNLTGLMVMKILNLDDNIFVHESMQVSVVTVFDIAISSMLHGK